MKSKKSSGAPLICVFHSKSWILTDIAHNTHLTRFSMCQDSRQRIISLQPGLFIRHYHIPQRAFTVTTLVTVCSTPCTFYITNFNSKWLQPCWKTCLQPATYFNTNDKYKNARIRKKKTVTRISVEVQILVDRSCILCGQESSNGSKWFYCKYTQENGSKCDLVTISLSF